MLVATGSVASGMSIAIFACAASGSSNANISRAELRGMASDPVSARYSGDESNEGSVAAVSAGSFASNHTSGTSTLLNYGRAVALDQQDTGAARAVTLIHDERRGDDALPVRRQPGRWQVIVVGRLAIAEHRKQIFGRHIRG